MVTLMDPPAPVGPLSAAAELLMPFSDTVKYVILGVSVTLLVLALGLLAWQSFRCCTNTHCTYTRQDTVNRNVLDSGEKSTTAEKYSGAPSLKVDNVSTELHRLSRLPRASGSSEAEGDEGEQLNKVEGSLRFSLHYDQPQRRLVVTVLQVEVSPTCCLQPFVKLRLMRAGSEAVDKEGERTSPVLWTVLQEWQTRIVKDSPNPLYGDQFSCFLHQDEDALHHVNLRMEVWDFDKFSRQTVLGAVRVPLGQLDVSCPLELHEALQVPQKDRVGEVLLSLKFLPTSQRVEVGLLKVRTVPAEICSDAAVYVRISVQCNQCKLKSQITSVVARCRVNVFNEVLVFSLPEFPADRCKIMISVYETHTTWKSPKHLIGQLTVGKEGISEDEHWDWMMRSARQPVAKWHGLLI